MLLDCAIVEVRQLRRRRVCTGQCIDAPFSAVFNVTLQKACSRHGIYTSCSVYDMKIMGSVMSMTYGQTRTK